MPERTIEANGLALVTEAFGDPARPPALLIMGVMASMLWWPTGLCERLAGRGHFVIRYDNRDTGLSTSYPPGAPAYTFADMADDAIRVIDGYGLAAAHLVGMSMGGMIAQLAALRHPARVTSLTVISASPIGVDTSGLPGMTEAYKRHAAEGESVDWSDRVQAIAYMVKDTRMIAGTAFPYDERAARDLATQDVARARSFASVTNHFVIGGGDGAKASDLRVALLVIHGTADPLIPIAHGAALQAAVPGSRLLSLEGGGHELHPGHWDQIVSAIAGHVAHAQGK